MLSNTENETEAREELIDTLLLISLLAKNIAQTLARLKNTANTKKGEHDDGEDVRTGRCPYRIVKSHRCAD